jgi:Ca2+-binding EF-hand superfamily protein
VKLLDKNNDGLKWFFFFEPFFFHFVFNHIHDCTGTIDFEEFLEWWKSEKRVHVFEEAQHYDAVRSLAVFFRNLDKNSNGTIEGLCLINIK